jgi:cytochrome c
MRITFGLIAIIFCLTGNSFAAEKIDPDRFEREVLVATADDPLSVEIARDGRVFFVERLGAIKMWDPKSKVATPIGIIPTHAAWDTGLLALLLAPDFLETGHFYVLRCPEDKHLCMRVARFTLRDGKLDLTSEKKVIEWAIDNEEPPHTGGGLNWDAGGNLLIGSGDNSPPQDVPAFDPSPGKELFDSRRSAANSQDLRGKILRIRPQPDGSYTIPTGNLFSDSKIGRPEIFAFGTRNPFRISADPKTGWILWGDVGGNVNTALDLGPEGYDEINLAQSPGFYGWPYASGNNQAWRPFDPMTKKPSGPPFDLEHLVNDSRGNAGLRELPPARPALIWYPTVASKEWPILGSGGRSVTGGPIFRYRPGLDSPTQLPEALDGCLIFAEWMRNWLMVARLSEDGRLLGLEPFMPGVVFRKPSDLKVGPDGALYVVEYGDRFNGNKDGQITRCVYRRGNRRPMAVANSDVSSGRLPLTVRFSAQGSRDPDGDTLSYRWKFGPGKTAEGEKVEFTFADKGRSNVELEVTDAHGAKATNYVAVIAGNSAPEVRFARPVDGSFFDWKTPIAWEIKATDAEDGVLPAEKVLLQWERRDRLVQDDGSSQHPGFQIMRAGTCFACHSATEKSAGPPYLDVARRYAGDLTAREKLAGKILTGGIGVWGTVFMPPHPQHTRDQARQMVDWILGLAARQSATLPAGLTGQAPPPKPESSDAAGVMVITASATDLGAAPLPPLRQEASVVLRTRKQRAAYFDESSLTSFQENLGDGLVARIQAGGWVAFHRIQLPQVKEIRVTGRPTVGAKIRIEARLDKPDGTLVGSAILAPAADPAKLADCTLPLSNANGQHTVYFIVKNDATSGPSSLVPLAELATLEFR